MSSIIQLDIQLLNFDFLIFLLLMSEFRFWVESFTKDTHHASTPLYIYVSFHVRLTDYLQQFVQLF